jgi:tetratricopeptide (TPR) repeat protein
MVMGLPTTTNTLVRRGLRPFSRRFGRWFGRCAVALCLVGCLASAARGDTIVLKNGRRIVGESVTQEDGKVTCETAAGQVTIPESLVARIEKNDLGSTSYPHSNAGAANLPMAPPVATPSGDDRTGLDAVAQAVVHDDSIDRAALARFVAGAASGTGEAVARAIAAESAAREFELMRGDFSAALEHSERALALAPNDATLLLNVAYLRLRRGEYTEALDFLDRARRQRPDSPDVAKLTGWADYGLNRLAQAVAEWKRAVELRPDADVAQALAKAERDFDTESNFREGESAHFVLRYNGSAAPELARAVLLVLEDDFQTLASALNFTPKEPIAVILYTSQAFGDITRAPNWVGALNDGRIRIPVQGLTTVTPELARVLKHELTHSFVNEQTHGSCPVWLQEGLAQWMEGKKSGDSAGLLVELYDRHEDPSLALLEGTWMNLSSDIAGVSYAWSLGVVEAIEAGSSSDINRLLDSVSTVPGSEGALRSALHMGYAELARSTAEYLRQTYLHQR